jgi:hypothetical protein
MRRDKTIFFVFIAISAHIQVISQDSLYAKTIDSLWLHSYNKKMLSKKIETIAEAKVEYSYYKNSNTIRCIVVLNKPAKENLLFFYLNDKLVMISPSGQQPYFIWDNRVAYAKQMQHTPEQVQRFIKHAYDYLKQGYERIKPVKL